MGTHHTIAVIGAGPAGLMAAEVAAQSGARVTVYDRMPSPGRKLLLAGRGGLNLTHSEGAAVFRARYGAAAEPLASSLDAMGPEALRHWCAELGIETFVGSSGRVFPASFKTSPLLRAWLRRLDAAGVRLAPRHRWLGWHGEADLHFAGPEGEIVVGSDATVLALGGATWPQLGSDATWVPILTATDVDVAPLAPSNCGFAIGWSEPFRERHAGQPIQNVALSCSGARTRGDVVVTSHGLEGGALYALSPVLRDAIARDGEAVMHVALRPDLSHDALVAKLGRRRPKQSFSTAMRKALALPSVAISLLREADRSPATLEPRALAALVNAVPVTLTAPMPMARAISTAGGVSFDALDADLMLRARPGTFVAGEMLDWEAPTGGYLLTACFATGRAAGQAAAKWAARRRGNPLPRSGGGSARVEIGAT